MEGGLKGARILVVGGRGFIGQHVLRQLRIRGCDPLVLDVAGPPPEFETLEWFTGSAADPALMASAASAADTVVFLAASSLPGSANKDLAGEVTAHVHLAVQAAEIASAQGVKRFVFGSSGGTVYGRSSDAPLREDARTEPRNAYGVSKLAIEHYLRLLGQLQPIETVSLRVSNPYGEGQRASRQQGFIAAAMQSAMAGRSMPIWGDGSVERDFIHVEDVARAFADTCAATAPPGLMNIGSGCGASLLEVLEMVEAATGREVPVAFEPGRQIDVQRNVLDITRARDSLGWTPQIPMAAGLARTARWWLAQEAP